MNKCPLCNYRYNDAIELEDHLLQEHFLSMQAYYEMEPLRIKDMICYKCGHYRPPLTYIEPTGFMMPCWDCITSKYEKTQYINTIRSAIIDYYGKVITDRYLQMFLINDIYFESSLRHTYSEFKDVLKELQKHNKYDRNKIWFLDWMEGYPRTICIENLKGIKVILIDDYYDVKSEKTSIRINSWKIEYPEIVPFDQRHHSKYNILNISGDSKNTKRLRLKNSQKNECIKFYNNQRSRCKSLFRITDQNGDVINPSQLSEQDLTVTKLVLLRNKSFTKLILSMVEELLGNVSYFSDSVFLKNTVLIDPNQNKLEKRVNISWLPEKIKDNYINISIL